MPINSEFEEAIDERFGSLTQRCGECGLLPVAVVAVDNTGVAHLVCGESTDKDELQELFEDIVTSMRLEEWKG